MAAAARGPMLVDERTTRTRARTSRVARAHNRESAELFRRAVVHAAGPFNFRGARYVVHSRLERAFPTRPMADVAHLVPVPGQLEHHRRALRLLAPRRRRQAAA